MQNSEHKMTPVSAEAFAMLGVNDIVYVKPVTVKGGAGFSVYSASGVPIAVTPSRETAEALALQNDMKPVSVH